jgi:hypothetical protein
MASSKPDALLQSVLWSASEIDKRVGELGCAISRDFEGLPIAILGVTFFYNFDRLFVSYFVLFLFLM